MWCVVVFVCGVTCEVLPCGCLSCNEEKFLGSFIEFTILPG